MKNLAPIKSTAKTPIIPKTIISDIHDTKVSNLCPVVNPSVCLNIGHLSKIDSHWGKSSSIIQEVRCLVLALSLLLLKVLPLFAQSRGEEMKALMAVALVMVSGASVQAASFEHPCEIVYYEINKEDNTTGYTMEDFLTCKEQFGTTKLIKRAEEYKKTVADRLEEVERRIQESESLARGERAGKIVQSFDLDEMLNHPKNLLRVPFTGFVRDTKKDKEYETSADKVCETLGFEKSISSTQSRLINARWKRELENAPERVFENETSRTL
jgi:hypothetical protein